MKDKTASIGQEWHDELATRYGVRRDTARQRRAPWDPRKCEKTWNLCQMSTAGPV